jgi:hypothetical protein
MRLRLSIVALCLLATAMASAAETPAAAETPSPNVAVVNGQAVTRAEFARSLLSTLGTSAMQAYVERVLVAQEARRQRITVTDAELQARWDVEMSLRLQAAQQETRMGPEEFRAAAADRGMSEEQVRAELASTISRDALRTKLLSEKLLESYVDLSDKALRAHYQRTRGRRFSAAHIMVNDQREAQRLVEVLRDRQDLWPDAVTAYSLDRASKPFKGRIGPVPAESPLGRVLAGMSPGALSVWQEGQLWHVVWMIKEVPASGEDFDKIKDRLRAELLALESRSKLYDLLADLWQNATVVVNMSPDAATRRALGEDVAAYVNGEAIRAEDLSEALVREFGPTTLPAYIERTLLFQEAARRGLTVPQQELDARLKTIGGRLFEDQAAQTGMSVKDFQEVVQTRPGGVEDLKGRLVREFVSRDDVRATLLAEQMVAPDVKVSEQDVQDAYKEYGGERYVVRDMAAETRAEAERVLDRIEQGASFDLLARTESAAPGVWLEGAGMTTVTAGQPWYERVKGLEAGQTSGIFLQDGKYHIIKVVEHAPPSERPPIESVRDKLEREVFLRKAMDRIQALLLKLRAESTITVNIEQGK